LTGRGWREGNRFHSFSISYLTYRDKRYIANGDN
jgi:hypothetical protein